MLTLILLSASLAFSQEPYITEWKTDNNGVSGANQIVVPAIGDYTYTWVDVNDPTIKGSGTGSNGQAITFPSAGEYLLRMIPSEIHQKPFDQIAFNGMGDKNKLIDIKQWGDVKWSSLEGAYTGAENLKITATDVPDLSNVTNIAFAFSGTGISTVPNMNNWDVSHVSDMQGLFSNTPNFNQPIGKWDVGNVTSMKSMFAFSSFNEPIGKWNVKKVENMSYMFQGNQDFNQDIGNWNVVRVTNMSFMFANATRFNRPIGFWNVYNVRNMVCMFWDASNFNQNLSHWYIRNITQTSGMFSGATNFHPVGKNGLGGDVQASEVFNTEKFDRPLGRW